MSAPYPPFLRDIVFPGFPHIFGQAALLRLRPDMLEEIQHGGAEPAYTLAQFGIDHFERFYRLACTFGCLGGFGTHEDAAGFGVGHHQFADMRFRVVQTLEGGAVDGIDEDAGLCRHLLALLNERFCLHSHGAGLHDQQVDGDGEYEGLHAVYDEADDSEYFVECERSGYKSYRCAC